MSVNQSFVDLVVARVIERLRSHPSVNQAASDSTTANVTTATSFFDETVLTEAILGDRINGATTIQIAPHTVLTPSARDYLRQRNVGWTRGNVSAETASGKPAGHRLIVLDKPVALASLAGSEWFVTNVSNVSEAVQAAIDSVQHCGAVVLAGPAEAIACEANRDQRVKAVATCSVERMKRAQTDLCPNVVCVDPNGLSLMELRNILKAAKG
jgi:hypothetical protein